MESILMPTKEALVPVRVAKLVIGYLNHTLTEEEKDLLDEWVCESEENEQVFVALIDHAEADKVDFARLIDQLELRSHYWRIAELITKEIESCINPEERKELQEWINAADDNRKLYKQLTHAANRKYFSNWLEQELSGHHNTSRD
jgi:hypothetical protein